MHGGILPYTLALAAAGLSGWTLYLAAPRQQWRSHPIPNLTAAAVALPLLAAGIWLMSGAISPAPGFFAMCAVWMLALAGSLWLAALPGRGRSANGA